MTPVRVAALGYVPPPHWFGAATRLGVATESPYVDRIGKPSRGEVMGKRVVAKIVSGVLALAQLAAGVYLVATGHPGGWALLPGAVGTALLPRLGEQDGGVE